VSVFNLRVRDYSHLEGIGDHDPLHVGLTPLATATALPVAAKTVRKLRRMAPPEHAVLPSDGPGKGPVYIKSYDAHAVPIGWLVNRTGAIAGNTTSPDPRSQRIRESREGGQVTSPAILKQPALWSATWRNWPFSDFEHLPPNLT